MAIILIPQNGNESAMAAQLNAFRLEVATLLGSAMLKPHIDTSEVAVTLGAAATTDLPATIALCNQIKHVYAGVSGGWAGHIADTVPHKAADATNTVSAADATTQVSASTLVNELKTKINAHFSQGGTHFTSDLANVFTTSASTTSDLSSIATLANACRTGLNAHVAASTTSQGFRVDT
jgi:hypothetical protein